MGSGKDLPGNKIAMSEALLGNSGNALHSRVVGQAKPKEDPDGTSTELF